MHLEKIIVPVLNQSKNNVVACTGHFLYPLQLFNNHHSIPIADLYDKIKRQDIFDYSVYICVLCSKKVVGNGLHT